MVDHSVELQTVDQPVAVAVMTWMREIWEEVERVMLQSVW